MNHRLSLEIPDTLQGCILRVQDTSSYVEEISVKCAQLQVSIPGFKNSVYIDNVQAGFSLNLTACDLKIQTTNCGSIYNDIPDGIYVIRYSVSPNDVVYVEYQILRVTKALNKLRAMYCELDLENCAPGPQLKKMRQDAQTIDLYLKAAQSEVAYCRSATKGLNLWQLANKMLDKSNCKGCKS